MSDTKNYIDARKSEGWASQRERDREFQGAIERQSTIILQSATSLKRLAECTEGMSLPARMDLRSSKIRTEAALAIMNDMIEKEDKRLEAAKEAV